MVQDCGMADVFNVTLILANSFYGPFDSAGFHQKAIDGMRAYKARASAACPLSQFFLQAIAQDMQMARRLHEPGFADEVWGSLGSGVDVLVKGPRMSMCRFYSIHEVYRHLRPLRTKRLFMWLYVGLHLGYVRSFKDCVFVDKLQVHIVKPDDTTAPMREGQAASMASMRAEAKDTIHFAIRILLNSGWHRKTQILCVVEARRAAAGRPGSPQQRG